MNAAKIPSSMASRVAASGNARGSGSSWRDGGRIAGAAYAAGALVLMHVLLVLATVLKFSEENRVMHLGSPRTRALFAPQAAGGTSA